MAAIAFFHGKLPVFPFISRHMMIDFLQEFFDCGKEGCRNEDVTEWN